MYSQQFSVMILYPFLQLNLLHKQTTSLATQQDIYAEGGESPEDVEPKSFVESMLLPTEVNGTAVCNADEKHASVSPGVIKGDDAQNIIAYILSLKDGD